MNDYNRLLVVVFNNVAYITLILIFYAPTIYRIELYSDGRAKVGYWDITLATKIALLFFSQTISFFVICTRPRNVEDDDDEEDSTPYEKMITV